jgi:hypothetical protein
MDNEVILLALAFKQSKTRLKMKCEVKKVTIGSEI